MFVNFQPNDTHHGQVAIFTGPARNVSHAQLKTITDSMHDGRGGRFSSGGSSSSSRSESSSSSSSSSDSGNSASSRF